MTPARERASIEVDEFLPHPPEKVWRALSEPGLLARWLMPNDFEPVVGHRFTFAAKPIPSVGFDGRIACEVLAVEEHRLLRISWHGGGLTPRSPGGWPRKGTAPASSSSTPAST